MKEYDVIDKLDHSVDDIRSRALFGILAKLEYGLWTLPELIIKTNLCQKVVKWFEISATDTKAETDKFINLVLAITNHESGSKTLSGLNLKNHLQRWRVRAGSEFFSPQCSQNIRDILANLHEESFHEHLMNDDASSVLSTYGSEPTREEESPAGILRSRNQAAIPPRLLRPSSRTAGSFSPVGREYFKKVQFDYTPDDVEDCALAFRIVNLPWIALNETDRHLLHSVATRLGSHDPEAIRDACVELEVSLMEDFPTEVFSQRPEIVKALLDVLGFSSNDGLQYYAATNLGIICKNLLHRIKTVHDAAMLNFKDETFSNGDISSSTSGSDSRFISGFPDMTINVSGDHNMTDRVEQSKMKEQQIPLYQLGLDVFQHGMIPTYSTNSLRLVNSVAESLHEALNLFEATVNSGEMWSNRNREVRIVCEELLENAHELAKLLSRFRRGFSSSDLVNEDISFHRHGYLLILQLATRYFTTFHLTSVRSPQLFQELAYAVYDPTLYLTHYSLHSRIKDACEVSEQFSETKRILTSMSKAVDFLQDTTKDAVQSCNEALLSFPIHRHPDIVPKFLRLCQGSSSSNEVQKNLIVITLLKMLGHQDQQLQTDCYLSLHALVQDVLGISHALDVSAHRVHQVRFLLDSRVFRHIFQFGLSHADEFVRQACEEIVLYFFKAVKFLSDAGLWKDFIETVLRPNLALLEPYAGNNSTLLGRYVLALYVTEKRMFPELPIDDILRGNMRLLFHPDSDVREQSAANLKCFVSKEPNSFEKLPRFSTIIQCDLSKCFALGNKEGRQSLCIRSIQKELNPKSMSSLIEVLDTLASPSSETVSLKSSLLRLEPLLLDPHLRPKFLDAHGLALLQTILDRALTETETNFPPDLVPPVMECLRVLVVHCPEVRQQLSARTDFLYSILRSAMLDEGHVTVPTVGAVCLLEDFFRQSEDTLTLNAFLQNRLMLPFECLSNESETVPDDKILDHLVEEFDLLKMYWNTSWFGVDGALNTREGDPFSDKLMLDKKDQLLLQLSFPQTGVPFCIESKIRKARDHSQFHDGIDILTAHTILLRDAKTDWSFLTADLKSFARILTVMPCSKADKKVFLSSLEFLSRLEPKSDPSLAWLRSLCADRSSVCFRLLLADDATQHSRTVPIISKFLRSLSSAPPSPVIFDVLLQAMLESNQINDPVRLNWLMKIMSVCLEATSTTKGKLAALLEVGLQSLQMNLIDGNAFVSARCTTSTAIVVADLVHKMKGSVQLYDALQTPNNFLIPLWTHRTPLKRVLGLQIAATLASEKRGAKALSQHLTLGAPGGLWHVLMSFFLDHSEGMEARMQAARCMDNLLLASDECDWFGPVIREKVSNVVITGDGATQSLFRLSSFGDEVSQLLGNFGARHRIRTAQPVDTTAVDSSNVPVESGMCPTPSMLAATFALTVTLLKNNDATTNTLCLRLDELLSGALISVDLSDPHLSDVIQELGGHSGYCELITELSRLVIASLSRDREGTTEIVRNSMTSMTMLTSSVIFLINISDVPLQVRNELSSSFLLCLAQLSQSLSNFERWKALITKYYEPLMTLAVRLLNERNAPESRSHILAASTFVSSTMLLELGVDENIDTLQQIVNDSRPEDLCQALLDVQDYLVCLHRTSQNCFIDMIVVNRSLSALLAICHPAKMFALEQKLMARIVSRTKELSDQLGGFKKTRRTQDDARRRVFDELRSLIKLLTNFSLHCLEVKREICGNNDLRESLLCLWPWLASESSLLSTTLLFISTVIADYPETASQLLINSSSSDSPQSLLGILMSMIGQEGNPLPVRERVFRILTSAVAMSVECRNAVCKGFVASEGLRDSKSADAILRLDLLLSITGFPDGQLIVAKQNDLLERIVTLASDQDRTVACLAAFAVIRNLCFHPANRTKLLLHAGVMATLKRAFTDIGSSSSIILTALSAVWSLAANNLKAKVAIRNSGITRAIAEDFQRRKTIGSIKDRNAECFVIVMKVLQTN